MFHTAILQILGINESFIYNEDLMVEYGTQDLYVARGTE
jgi:hypothetical protein